MDSVHVVVNHDKSVFKMPAYNEKASIIGRPNGSLFEYADKLLPYQVALVQLSNLHFFLGSSLIPCIMVRWAHYSSRKTIPTHKVALPFFQCSGP